MKIEDFEFLKELSTNGNIVLNKNKNYAEEIYKANIPYRPGIYMVFSLNTDGEDKDLLYYGKAGVTNNNNNPVLNFHQLPKRLIATSKAPENHPEFDYNKDITRAKLWPWYVENKFKHGIRIYWFITEWPKQNPNEFEKKIKSKLKAKYPKWKKSI